MKKLLTPALALTVLAVFAGPAIAQGWSVAIEQNAMVTNCASTTNIPVAGATDCASAKAAAWNLLTTLLQTPNCMSSGCAPGSTVTQGVSTCTPDPYTRPNGSPAMRWQVSWTWNCVPPPPLCPGNLIQNGDFTAGLQVVGNGSMPQSQVSNWSLAFATPQISSGMGCGNNGLISMWGNQVAGEAIKQTLSVPLVSGAAYRFSACVKWHYDSTKIPPYVRFKVRASNGSLASYVAPGAQIGIIGLTPSTPSPSGLGITSTTWTTYTLQDWIATGNFNTITINPENASAANDGAQTSWGDIDNVCLQRIIPCVLSPGMIAASNTFARRITLAQTFTPTQSGSLTKITHGLQSISGVTNYDLLVTTTTGALPSWTGGTYNTPNVLYKATGLTVFSNSAMVNGSVTIPSGQQPYLTAGTQYALILIPGTPTSGDMKWRGNSGASSYPSGSAYELNGTTWTVPTTGPKDHGFKLDGLCP
jgi:hypothetical protein